MCHMFIKAVLYRYMLRYFDQLDHFTAKNDILLASDKGVRMWPSLLLTTYYLYDINKG